MKPEDSLPVAPETVTCSGCGGAVPNGSIYCPHCCGEDSKMTAVKGGALRGAVLGVIGGLLFAALWFAWVGMERGTWGMVFGFTVAGGTTGLMLGMVRQRKK